VNRAPLLFEMLSREMAFQIQLNEIAEISFCMFRLVQSQVIERPNNSKILPYLLQTYREWLSECSLILTQIEITTDSE
jgi:pantothenate kinase